MTRETIDKLNNLNKDFYDTVAPYFDTSRQYFWDGWEPLWDFLIENEIEVKKILDLACGNGRFYKYLQNKINALCHSGHEIKGILKNDFKYLGVDINEYLIDHAKLDFPIDQVEVFNKDLFETLNDASFKNANLITAFGILHHIPSFDLRLRFFQDMKEALYTDGIACISIWKFHDSRKSRIVDWNKVDVDIKDLDENDFLLSWKRGKEAYRYSHYVSEQEEKDLIKQSGLTIQKEYLADGKSSHDNKYLILSK